MLFRKKECSVKTLSSAFSMSTDPLEHAFRGFLAQKHEWKDRTGAFKAFFSLQLHCPELELRAAGSITLKVRDRQSHLDNPPGTTYVHNSKMINERVGEMF